MKNSTADNNSAKVQTPSDCINNRTVYGKFREIVDRYPDMPAVIEDDRQLTFAQLDHLADGILSKFYDRQPSLVGIVMSHGVNQIAAMLAVLKSGAGYVPAEPFLPKDRIDYMMKTAGVDFIIDDQYCSQIPKAISQMPDRSRPDGIAYILFTSGTTGRPKGVVIENHSVANYAEAFAEEMHVGPGDIMLQFSICSFDIFVEEVFASLLNSVAVAIPTPEIHDGSKEQLMKFCDRHQVTILDGFPYLLADLNKRPSMLPESVSLIISGGDVVRENYINRLRKRGVRIYNTYGPSETTVCSNYYRIDNAKPLPDGTYPVGRKIKGVDVKIMDADLREVAPGEIGEICITGEGVGRGYIGNPPEQANFVTLPDGTRLYRSGDLGYVLPDGNIAFLHRKDDQVMILGRRVEPDEVENVLNEFADIDRGVVRAFEDENGLHYLVAYIVPRKNFSLSALRSWMASKLADFMIPEYFVKLKEIPVTHRGKVDTKALPVVLKTGDYAKD